MAETTGASPAIILEGRQWLRKAKLLVTNKNKVLDLSEMHFKFAVESSDFQTPNNAAVRIYNLSETTMSLVRKEYERVVVQVGYEGTTTGVIFQGDIKQFRLGREGATDRYLDILAADADLGYNFAITNRSWPAGSTAEDHIKAAAEAMGARVGTLPDFQDLPDMTNTNPSRLSRGKVGFGMARDLIRNAASTMGSTWSIQNGVVQVIPLRGYLRGDAVIINKLTGMVGIPEQTDEGIKVQCLINPKIRIGGLIQLNNKDINQIIQKDPSKPFPYNQWAAIQYAAKVADGADGQYRVYALDHVGDTRGNEWMSTMICLLINPAKRATEARG